MKKQLLTLIAASWMLSGFSQTISFNYTGDLDSLIIPNCVDSVIINVWGAEGGATIDGGISGRGAFISARMDVTTGDKLYILVGGQDGFNGGGTGGFGNPTTGLAGYAGNGGGASDVRINGIDLNNRILVAGGGGGAGRHYWNGTCTPCGMGGNGGDGGITTGMDGQDAIDGGYGANPGGAGKGGTQTAGGAGGLGTEGDPGNPGIIGQGGDGIDGEYSVAGGGGGGGYYGGGSGSNAQSIPGSGVGGSGGGGGSSYYDPTVLFVNGVAGVRFGNGQVTITYILSSPIMTTAVGQSDITLNALQAGVTYQWLNCGTGYSAVGGATNQSFTATANGSYAVELDNGNGCVDTSACVSITQVGLEENSITNIQVYPNPISDLVTISLPASFEMITAVIYDAEGREVISSNESGQTFTLNTEALAPGVYVLKLSNENGIISTNQLVKE